MGSNVIRGHRVGSSPTRPDENMEPCARRRASYWCVNGHVIQPAFAADVIPPATWDCPHCGLPAGRDPQAPPLRQDAAPYKTHFAYVQERRTEAEGAALLAEALQRLQQRRGR